MSCLNQTEEKINDNLTTTTRRRRRRTNDDVEDNAEIVNEEKKTKTEPAKCFSVSNNAASGRSFSLFTNVGEEKSLTSTPLSLLLNKNKKQPSLILETKTDEKLVLNCGNIILEQNCDVSSDNFPTNCKEENKKDIFLWKEFTKFYQNLKLINFNHMRKNLVDNKKWKFLPTYFLTTSCALFLFLKRLMFSTVEFFCSRRVMFVLLFIAILLGYYKFHDDILSLKASFVVADEDRPGIRFFKSYITKRKHPVMIIPGFISTALEVWEDQLMCLEAQRSLSSNFRQRMFSPQLLLLLIFDPICYLKLFSLDKQTGFDPPGVKIRPDMGFSASDFFLPGYWIWAKILLNLRDIGYDPQSVGVLSYDWRLSPRRMHKRDGLYHYLRNNVQYLCEKNKDRVVIISHSYGTNVFIDFLRWSEKHDPDWVKKYVAYWVNIGGPVLGAAKAVSAVLAGDAKDTLTLPSPIRQLLETHLSRSFRIDAVRTWSCLIAMYPVGCNDFFPDILTLPNGTRLTPKESLRFTAERLKESGHEAQQKYATELFNHFDELPSIPSAPNMTIVCLYGVDKETEVGYILSKDDVVNSDYHQTKRAINGVILGNGDGTVPLMSLGYMCRAQNGWKQNVARVITREHKHDEGPFMDLRGGVNSGDHVDILGNYDLIDAVLRIVSGNAEEGELTDRIYSDVDEQIAKATECRGKK